MPLLGGRYELGPELSRGGMGRLHVALDLVSNARVAIKRPHDEHDHARLIQEARLAGLLDHRNIVRVLDVSTDAEPYLVLELLEGETLRARLERGRLATTEAVAFVRGIADGLAAAHAAGIVHRDLKPENIFLAGETVKLLDFGVAKAPTTERTFVTTTGSALGTPAYMSPEQAVGDRDVDATSDLWALGVIAYECLLGQRPFAGESLGELVLQICAWPLPVPSRHAAVPAGFDAWFATACHRERTSRFASAEVQAAAFARLAAPTRPRRRRSLMIVFAAAIAGAVATAPVPSPRPAVARTVAPRIVVALVDAADASTAIVTTEELVARLARHTGVHVVGRESHGDASARPVRARLVETQAGFELVIAFAGSERTFRGAHLEALCQDAASAIATHLGLAPRRSSLHAPQAFATYRTARFHATDDPASALTGYEAALAEDPSLVAAHVAAVDAALLMPWFGHDRAAAHARAREHAADLPDDDARALVARGRVAIEADRDYAAGDRAFRAALALDPDLAAAHERLGDVRALRRDFGAALASLDRAIALDPQVARHHMYRARTLYHAGRYRDAVVAADRALALNAREPFAAFIRGFALVKLGDFDAGLAAIRAEPTWRAPAARPIAAAQELWVAHARGDRGAVARLREEVGRDVPALSMFMLAFAMATLDEPRAQILDALEAAYDRHDPFLPLAAALPELAPLHAEPRFRALLARMHL